MSRRPDSKLFNVYEGTLGGPRPARSLWFFTAGRYRKRDSQSRCSASPARPTPSLDKERRLEGKLTAQITPKHSVVGSYFDIKQDQINNCFGNCYEVTALDNPRKLPNSFALHQLQRPAEHSTALEASYARQQFRFVGGGGIPTGDRATSSVIVTNQGSNRRLPAVLQHLRCTRRATKSQRQNQSELLLAPKGFGTHT